MPRVAIVTHRPTRIWADPKDLDAFREGLAELGHTEGTTSRVEYCTGEGDPTRLPTLLSTLIERGVDVICAPVPLQSRRRSTQRP